MIQEMTKKIIELLNTEGRGLFLDEIFDKVEGSYTPEQFEFVIGRMLKQELIITNEEEDIFYLNN